MAAFGTSSTSGFIGRERELAELGASMADVTTGHGHLFLLSGEPGIGKTRLADEFGRLALARGVRVAWVGAGREAVRPHTGRGSRSFAPIFPTPIPKSERRFSAPRLHRESHKILRSSFRSWVRHIHRP